MLLAVPFWPTLFALIVGQISPWLLLGVVGFLHAERSRRDLLAGASLALLMIKPQVAYLFWLAALWWAWHTRRWRVVAGWLGMLTVATGLVLLFAPEVFASYLAVPRGPLLDWATATVGIWLRVLFGLDRHWLQFVPSLLGILGLALWLRKRRGPWRWQYVASPLLLASVATTAYGWSHDHLVLLPVVVDLVARLRQGSLARKIAVISALIASQVAIWMLNQYGFPDAFNFWHAPVLALIYWLGTSHDRMRAEPVRRHQPQAL
jgi:hypothetical protein